MFGQQEQLKEDNDKIVTSHHQTNTKTTDVCCDVIDHVVYLLRITPVSVQGHQLVFVTRHEKMCLKYGLDTSGGPNVPNIKTKLLLKNKKNKLTE